MKVLLAFLAVVFLVECHHFMLGTNVGRPKLHLEAVSKPANENRYRSKNVTYSGSPIIQVSASFVATTKVKLLDKLNVYTVRISCTVQKGGILAYDIKGSNSTVELLQGGIGYNHTKLKLRGEKSKSLHYKVYIYG